MQKVIVSKPKSDSLGSQLVALANTLQRMQAADSIFDFQDISWAFPLLILPIAILIHETQSRMESCRPNVDAYLKTIKFPHGISSVSGFSRKHETYIPIGHLTDDDVVGKEKLSSMFDQLIYQALSSVPGSRDAVYYPISELVTNIFEHSQKNDGWIFAQKYPRKDHLDICIADHGRGLAQAYRDEKGLTYTDKEAIEQAIMGHSTKSEVERGYGLRTSKRVVCEGMNGSFILISGNSALIQTGTDERIVELPGPGWSGVIVSYRIPKPLGPVDIYKYLE